MKNDIKFEKSRHDKGSFDFLGRPIVYEDIYGQVQKSRRGEKGANGQCLNTRDIGEAQKVKFQVGGNNPTRTNEQILGRELIF